MEIPAERRGGLRGGGSGRAAPGGGCRFSVRGFTLFSVRRSGIGLPKSEEVFLCPGVRKPFAEPP